MTLLTTDRRRMLAGALALGGGAALAPRVAFARTGGEARLVFVIQRGAADGLATLAPLGDPAYAGLRGDLAQGLEGGTKLDAMFTLHPALARVAGLYQAKQALFAHAVASPYRDRSHFDGQNVLETGSTLPYARTDGWLNRLLGLLPPPEAKGLAIAATVPAALRGRVEVASYAPSALPQAGDELIERVGMLYASDPQLHALWDEALQTRAMASADGAMADPAMKGKPGGGKKAGGAGGAATGQLAAALMSGANGARVVTIETTGWDTHSGQTGRLNAALGSLDAMIGALQDGLGPAWAQTLVIVATEFGRTAAANGTGGTDHGTGSLAMLLGGAVKGGRVLADWPGLKPADLYQGRDLKPTAAIDALLGSAAAAHFGLDPERAARVLFPGIAGAPVSGLVAS